MKEANITSVLPQAYLFSTQGCAAVINDRKFILRAEPLERNIRLLQACIPCSLRPSPSSLFGLLSVGAEPPG